MAYLTSNSADDSDNIRDVGTDCSGDELESRSGGGNDRLEIDIIEKPSYLLEHLATFTVNKESGIVYPSDGMRRLLQLEKTSGIWSQKMQLCMDHQWVLIMDYESGNIIERFPANLIQDPTAYTSTDAMELYNNILVFIVSGTNSLRSEMHIFQSQTISAVHLVEDLKNLRLGKTISHQKNQQYYDPLQTSQKEVSLKSQNNFFKKQQPLISINKTSCNAVDIQSRDTTVSVSGTSVLNIGEIESDSMNINDETSSVTSDKYERDVTVLNHCFDDIEKFIARLQHAAAASRELERRRLNRKSKKKDIGEGLLSMRTRPPQEKEFFDIFSKFKLSFNLLAKLKAHIHDPNAPELVHFLFTPLALIVEASTDTYYDVQLPSRVINPLLTREAINLLINCVTSKETELWRSLGDVWTISRDQWKDNIGSYHPVFLDGWSPDFVVVDEIEPIPTPPNTCNSRAYFQALENRANFTMNIMTSRTNNHNQIVAVSCDPDLEQYGDKYNTVHKSRHHLGAPPIEQKFLPQCHPNLAIQSEPSIDSIGRNVIFDACASNDATIINNLPNIYTCENSQNNEGNALVHNYGGPHNVYNIEEGSGLSVNINGIVVNGCDDELTERWLEKLILNGAKIVVVTYPRTANNDKELSVIRGEYLEVLDDTRKWWKAQNVHGKIAHVPHTIITPYNYRNNKKHKPTHHSDN